MSFGERKTPMSARCSQGWKMRAASQLLVVGLGVLGSLSFAAQTPAFFISGTITSGNTKLPGVVIIAESIATGDSITTASDEEGHYRLAVPTPGTYRVRAELFGFSPANLLIEVADHEVQANFTLSLAAAGSMAANNQSPVASSQSTVPSSQSPVTKQAMPLSADLLMDFSFVTGQLAQPAVDADIAGTGGAARRQWPVHFSASYQARNSALDASPYALNGIAAAKPEYAQNTFSAGLSSTLPWGKKSATTSISANYNGNRQGNPYSVFGALPSTALRAGEFSDHTSPSGQAVTIYDPLTGEPFAGNRIPLERMSPAALALLEYIPLPNRDGVAQNFRFIGVTRGTSDGFGLSLTRRPASLTNADRNTAVRSNLSASFGYRKSSGNQLNIFPRLGGGSTSQSWNASLGYTLTKNFFTSNWRLGFNSMSSSAHNHFHDDIAAKLGINGISRDRFDWGLPAVDFTQFTGLHDVTPALNARRNFSFADTLSWNHNKHNLKWGGEFRRLTSDLRRNSGAEGSFVFTGFATAQYIDGVPVPGTGSDFADFLLGLPQKTQVQYSDGAFSFQGNAWNLYFVDDWRVAKNVSLNLGLRYEYVSPLSEARNRLVTLDAPPDFSSVAVVRAGEVGPFSGRFPNTIVAPDRNNFAPRIGVAWRAAERFILRAGYSINYDTNPYNSLPSQLALQPPFAVGQIGIAMNGQTLTLEDGFPAVRPDNVSNDFAVARKLPLGYAQVWVLEVQNELPAGFALVTSYTGTKGTHLAMLRAPNRTATGLLLPNVGPFLWQTADGASILHAGSVALSKRLGQGLSFGVSYMFSRLLDNDPSLGDAAQVAQDDRDLHRERGLSAFDQRHRLKVNYVYELPFGRGRTWLSKSGTGNRLLGDWSLSSTIGYGSGSPLTPYLTGDPADVAAGAYGALRPDLTAEPIRLSHPTVDRFFNTGAFVAAPSGHYGNAARNSIIGPSVFTMDAAIQKSFVVRDRYNFHFQAQVTNLLNTPQFNDIDTKLNSRSYGQITGVAPMRTIQLGLRYSF